MTAFHYLLLLLGIGIGLFVIALFLPNKTSKSFTKNTPKDLSKDKLNYPLQSLFEQTNNILEQTSIQSKLSERYITLLKNGKQIAMITLDNKLKTNHRKLNNVIIINFQKFPSKKQQEQKLLELGILSKQ